MLKLFAMDKIVSSLEKTLKVWETTTLEFLPKLLVAFVVCAVFFALARLAKSWCLRSFSRIEFFQAHRELAGFLGSAISLFFVLSGVFIALQFIGLEQVLTKLLAGAGIVGVIAGFAFKDIASNAFAGLLLNSQRPFVEDDWVQIGENYGKVAELGWLTTAVDTVSGQRVFVPNQLIYSATFTNYSTFGRRRVVLKSGVSYGDNLEHVRTVALETVSQVSQLLTESPVDFYYTDIGGSTYNFQLRFWIRFQNNDDYQKAMSDIIMKLKSRFEEENISIAYPVTSLDFGVKGGVNLFDRPLPTVAVSSGEK